jgi:4-oxalocrotonate tautomerase
VPLVEVTIAEGRTAEQVRNLMRELHRAVLGTVDTRPEHIRVIVREVPRSHWATGDVTLTEMDAARASEAGLGAGQQHDRRSEVRSDGVIPGDRESS